MKPIYLISLLVLPYLSLWSQNIDSLIKDGNRLEAVPNEKAAFAKFKEVLKLQPVHLYALVKCSELCSRIGARESNQHIRDSYNEAAITYARTALRLYPNDDEANVAMGIAVGRTLLTKSGKEKISLAKDIKKYADNAIRINPHNFKAWHILGKWHYEVSHLTMFERTATKIFYGGLPDASLKESISAYEKAKSLNPYFLLNYLELANAYKRNGETGKAIPLLKSVLRLPAQTEDDPRIKQNAARLLKKWE